MFKKVNNMLCLSEDVYVVYGKTNAAIYDLKYNKLYHLDNEESRLIKIIEEREDSEKLVRKTFIDELLNENILFEGEEPQWHYIDELKIDYQPEFAWIEVTNKCNLKCIHCYEEATCEKGIIMSYEDYCHIINELVNNNIKRIQIIGGEPFIIGRELEKYLDYAKGKFASIQIFTNGTLIDDEWIEYIRTNDISILLSVYSYIEEEHNKVTLNKNSWEKTNNTIRKFKEKGINYSVKNVLMKDIKLGNKNTNLYSLNPNKDVIRLTGRANKTLMSEELLKKKQITEKSFSRKFTRKYVEKCVSGHNCFLEKLYFSVDLCVYPCVMERRIKHGYINNNKLVNILDKKVSSFNKDNIKICKDCEFRYCCFDCRADSNGEQIDSKPWYCTYDPINGVWKV